MPKLDHVHTIKMAENLQVLGHCGGRNNAQSRCDSAHILLGLPQPLIAPRFRLLAFPEDRTHRRSAESEDFMYRIAAGLTLWDRYNPVSWERSSQHCFERQLLYFALHLLRASINSSPEFINFESHIGDHFVPHGYCNMIAIIGILRCDRTGFFHYLLSLCTEPPVDFGVHQRRERRPQRQLKFEAAFGAHYVYCIIFHVVLLAFVTATFLMTIVCRSAQHSASYFVALSGSTR